MDELQKENAELKKQLDELRFQVGANLELINLIVHKTHELLSKKYNCNDTAAINGEPFPLQRLN